MAKIVDARTLSDADTLIDRLELGDLIVFQDQAFDIQPDECALISPTIFSGESKNASLDPSTGRVSGVALEGGALRQLSGMMARYAEFAQSLLANCAPAYMGALNRRRTSFRPGEVSSRALSPRKDDRRLHIDAFPSNPTQGRRILRVFTNVDPQGRDRIWRIGGQNFEIFARAFRPKLKRAPHPQVLAAMQALNVTRGRRTAYDHTMLQLHDLAKLDETFQTEVPQTTIALPAGASWIVYTDSVLHAAMAGQHLFEQTFLLEPSAMREPECAPVRILERLLAMPLV